VAGLAVTAALWLTARRTARSGAASDREGKEPPLARRKLPAPLAPEPRPDRPAAAVVQEHPVTSGPLISVILARGESSVGAATAALAAQTYRDWELVVVDLTGGPPVVPADGRVAIVAARIGDPAGGLRQALGRATGAIVTTTLPDHPDALADLAAGWLRSSGRVEAPAVRADAAYGALLDHRGVAFAPDEAAGGPASDHRRWTRPSADGAPRRSWPARRRRPVLTSAGG
jgi:hypothetical protein